jgi:hypothetical protein
MKWNFNFGAQLIKGDIIIEKHTGFFIFNVMLIITVRYLHVLAG